MKLNANKEIREELRKNDIALWQLAEVLNVHEQTVCRWLRTELSPDKKQKITDAIIVIISRA